MIPRDIEPKLRTLSAQFPIVSLTGPRQSGKSTLLREAFPDYRYVSLEDPDTRALALEDPRSFLSLYPQRTIIDEAQHAPELFSYLQGVVDETGEPGQYLLSGSQNFLLMRGIAQSLAGRVGVLNLLPLSGHELHEGGFTFPTWADWVLQGGYPRIYQQGIDPADYFPSYIQTYLDRDVRQEAGVAKLAEFNRFLALCATRVAEMLKVEPLASACGITAKTARSWLSALEASFITFLLQPYYRNYGKRVVKTPKLLFFDTGLACNLAGLEDAADLMRDERRGPLFENAVIAELLKRYYAKGRQPKLYYWRDRGKKEVDLIIERGAEPFYAVEVKSSATFQTRFFKNLDEVAEAAGVPVERRVVVYAGEQSFETSHGLVLSVADLGHLVA